MFLAWLLLLTGLTISAVAIYYSVVGLAAIFSAAVIPIIVMGTTLEVAKLVCASWLKANWDRAPGYMKYYMISAVVILMLITSMGIFGFLSKAHNDQSLVSGDVQSKIAIYDEKIKTAKENIDANRKALKQMDEAVDQVMGRSSDEKGADKAVAIRRSQQKERVRLQSEIATEQKAIASLNEERAPIAAEVRKVEAEVGPIKYIAKFIYGDKGADENMLEKAVTWVIILIVIVFDPLAVIMLLAAQMTFGWAKKNHDTIEEIEEYEEPENVDTGYSRPWPFVSDLWPFPKRQQTQTTEEIDETPATALGGDITAPEESKEKLVNEAPYQPGYEDVAVKDDAGLTEEKPVDDIVQTVGGVEAWNKMLEEAEKAVEEEKKVHTVEPDFPKQENIEQADTGEESKKKTYIIKDQKGQQQTKEKK